jgi:hypothetical protein
MAAILISGLISAQNKAIDQLFNKYQGKEGVTTVMIGPELFQVIKSMDVKEMNEHDIPMDKLSSVKILTIEDEEKWEGVNFFTEVEDELDVSGYAEVMTVNDGGEIVKMWLKNEGQQIKEFLLIVGGDDNVLIYITGDFNLKDIEGIAESFDQDLDLDI